MVGSTIQEVLMDDHVAEEDGLNAILILARAIDRMTKTDAADKKERNEIDNAAPDLEQAASHAPK